MAFFVAFFIGFVSNDFYEMTFHDRQADLLAGGRDPGREFQPRASAAALRWLGG